MPLPAEDMDVINQTLSESGVVPASETSQAKSTKPKSPDKSEQQKKPENRPVTLTSQDLRCYIAPSSALATALADDLALVEPRMRKHVQTTTVLRKFLSEHDETLAELFSNQMN